jgi:CHAT domain-containing protein
MDLDGFAALPGAAAEAKDVAGAHIGARVFDGDESAAAMMKALERIDIFHFAGHAVSNLERPELSFLAVRATMRISAREIAQLDLRNLEIAVLSACSTQGAARRRGGMTNGLAFSFLLAGARATVSSLWDVADVPTRDFQQALHHALAQRNSAAYALRATQLKFIRGSDRGRRDPRIWAAFVVSGR